MLRTAMLRTSLIALFAVAAQAVIKFPVCPEPSQLICDGVDMSKPTNAQDQNGVSYTTFPLFQGPSALPDIINFQCIGETLYCSTSNGPVDCSTDTFAPLYKCRCGPVSSICGPDKSLPFCVGDTVYCSTNSAQLGIPITSATPLAPTSLCPNVTATALLDASLNTTAGSVPTCQPISNNGLVIEPGAAGASSGGKRSCSLLDFTYTINGVDNSRIVSQVSFDYKCPSTGNKWRNFQAVRDGYNWSPSTEGFFGLFGKPCFLRRENTAVETMLKATVDTGAIEVAEASLTSADGSEVTTLKFLCTQSIFN